MENKSKASDLRVTTSLDVKETDAPNKEKDSPLDIDTAPASDKIDTDEPPSTSNDSRDSILIDSASETTRPTDDTSDTSPWPIMTIPDEPLADNDTEPPEILTADPADTLTSPDDNVKDPDETPDAELIDTLELPPILIDEALLTFTEPPDEPSPPDRSKVPPLADADTDTSPLPDTPEPDSSEIDPPAPSTPATSLP